MCHKVSPPKSSWADKAAAAAHLPQPPEKPKLLPTGDQGWTFLCLACDRGVYDPSRAATSCPGCKGKLLTGDSIQATLPTSQLGTLTKKTIETERMLDGIGSDGVTPKTLEDKQTEEKLTGLRKDLVTLENMKEGDFGSQIAAWKKEIKVLEKTLISPEVKLLRGQTAVQYTLAEYEQKQATAKIKLEGELAKGVEKGDEAVAQGHQRAKDINEEMRVKLAIAKQAMGAQVAQAEEAIKVAKQKLVDLAKETTERVAAIKTKATPIMQKAVTVAASNAGNQAALIPVAPGAIVHPNHLTPQMFMDAVAPTLPWRLIRS